MHVAHALDVAFFEHVLHAVTVQNVRDTFVLLHPASFTHTRQALLVALDIQYFVYAWT